MLSYLSHMHNYFKNELTFKKSKKAGLVAQDFLRIPTAVLKLFTYSLYASNTMDLEN